MELDAMTADGDSARIASIGTAEFAVNLRRGKKLTVLFSGICLLCGLRAGGGNVCAGCRADLPWIRLPCHRCGAPRSPEWVRDVCAQCRPRLAAVDRCRTALIYEYPVDRLVTRAKFQSRAECARALGELLSVYLRAARIGGSLAVPDVLVPVPLHRDRQARRGFNQAAELARPVARQLRLPVLLRGCARTVNTIEQTALTGAARRANIRGAFRVTADLTDARIAIIDDVLTTGSTVTELAKTLRLAGAASVEVWTAARSARQITA
jgi:ComF family protein